MLNTTTLMRLIRSEISDYPLNDSSEITESEIKTLYSISKKHDVAHIVGAAIFEAGIPLCDEVRNDFKKEQF